MHSSLGHSLNEAPTPYNMLLLRCRPGIVAHPPAVPVFVAIGLASAGLKETFRSLPYKKGCARCIRALDVAHGKGDGQSA